MKLIPLDDIDLRHQSYNHVKLGSFRGSREDERAHASQHCNWINASGHRSVQAVACQLPDVFTTWRSSSLQGWPDEWVHLSNVHQAPSAATQRLQLKALTGVQAICAQRCKQHAALWSHKRLLKDHLRSGRACCHPASARVPLAAQSSVVGKQQEPGSMELPRWSTTAEVHM